MYFSETATKYLLYYMFFCFTLLHSKWALETSSFESQQVCIHEIYKTIVNGETVLNRLTQTHWLLLRAQSTGSRLKHRSFTKRGLFAYFKTFSLRDRLLIQ